MSESRVEQYQEIGKGWRKMEEKCNFPAIAVPMVEIAESGIKCSRFNGQESGRTYASNTCKSSVSYTEI